MPPLVLSISQIVRFAVVLTRLSGIFVLAPLYSSQSIPVSVRIAFTLVATLVLAPCLPLASVPAGITLGALVGLFFSEILIGSLLGLAASLVFAGLQLAGQMMSFLLGFSLINLIDPQTDVEAPTLSFLQNYLGLLFFLLINGHHWFLLAVRDSFGFLPVGGVRLGPAVMAELLHLSSGMLLVGIRIAGPVIAVIVITDVVMGVVGRAAPQLNLMIVGMPLKILIGFWCLSFSLYFLPRLLGETFGSLSRTLSSLLHAMV